LAGLVPFGLAAAWIPVRSNLPNTVIALLMVVGVAGLAMAGGPITGVVASVTAVMGFDFFDAAPYGQLLMTETRDVVTAIALLFASLVAAGLAVSLRNQRSASANQREDFNVMASAARMASFGDAAGVVVAALAGELVTRLDLRDCEFVYGPPAPGRPYIRRDGTLAGGTDPAELDLPVWSGNQLRGYYRLSPKSPSAPPPDRLLAAVGIAEQAGAALATQPVDPDPGPVRRRLRLVR
jgi:hypothetical protein